MAQYEVFISLYVVFFVVTRGVHMVMTPFLSGRPLAMFDLLANSLAFLYDLWPSYGGSIVLFTLAIMLVLTPLSLKSSRSMIAMQRLAPELKKLQKEHKDDREALNREMMALYQEHKVSPFSSCLPMLLQMPVFFILYRVLSGLTSIGKDGNFNPKYLDAESSLAIALRKTNEMMSFGMDLSKGAIKELQTEGIITALPYLFLVAIVGVTAYYQQRQVSSRNPNAEVNPQQQMVMKLMPAIFVFMSTSLPAGVVLYFVVSNIVRIAQQGWITRVEYGDDKPGKIIETRVVQDNSKSTAKPAVKSSQRNKKKRK